MGKERLCVGVGTLPARRTRSAVAQLASVEANLVDCVNLLAYGAVVDKLLELVGGLGEEVVVVAAEVYILLGGVGDKLACVRHLVAYGLLDEDVLARVNCLHSGEEVEGSVVVTAGCDVHDVKLGMCLEHVLEGIISLYAVLFGGLVGLFLDDVADGDKLGFKCHDVSSFRIVVRF